MGSVVCEDLPGFVRVVIRRLKGAGYQGYLVGGCVRDALLGRKPADYDVATDAQPREVMALFPGALPVGAAFGTVLVTLPGPEGGEVHVTTFRLDLDYRDGRRPSAVQFSRSVVADLARRDFTMNAIAWDPEEGEIVDPFGGREDVRARLVRAVGDPAARMREDALRALRAVRFATQFGFDIDLETWHAIEAEAQGVRRLSAERVRAELLAILGAPECGRGLWMMVELGLFFLVLPELKGAERMPQAKRDAPTLLDHLIQTAANAPPDPILRFAALLHDVGKLHTRALGPDGRVHFHGHEKVSGQVAQEVCRRLRFSRVQTERIVSLVEMHMALGPGLTKKSVRRWVARYGADWVRDLLALVQADRTASGWSGNAPELAAVRRLLSGVLEEEKALKPSDLAVNGHDVMAELGLPPGPAVGRVLARLYEWVLEDPAVNERDRLLERIRKDGAAWAHGDGQGAGGAARPGEIGSG